MFKRNTVYAILVSALAVATLCFFSTLAAAQKGPQGTTGAPLKGVDVKLGKNPGGSPAARTTGDDGKINWGVLAKGSYYLTVEVPAKQKTAIGEGETFVVKISGATEGTITRGWDPKKKKAFTIPANAQARMAPEYTDTITFHSDGVHPLFTTIVKSKSNISNN
jgi:hypothetical protein